MPTYRSITISLISQFDILTIPEYAPPTTPTDPFSNAPTLINPDHSLVSVYIPTYPSSQFWLSYSISPPHPPKLLYYFKLYLNGILVVSWGCGEDDDYRGKTMFGLFKPVLISGLTKGAALQRRVFCFGPDTASLHNRGMDSLSDVMEIKVFRSKGRKRIKPDIHTLQSVGIPPNIDRKRSQQQAANRINLINAGDILDKHPHRYYKYALLDPLDAPFATFRYYYRSWDQLEALGVISPHPSECSSITSIESSSVRSQQDLAVNAERPLPRSKTLEPYVSVSASIDNTATNRASNMAEEPLSSSTTEAATATNPKNPSIEDAQDSNNPEEATTVRTTDDDAESQSTIISPEEYTLMIPMLLTHPLTSPLWPTLSKTATNPKNPSIEDSQDSNNPGEATTVRTTDDDAESKSTIISPEECPLMIPMLLTNPLASPFWSTQSKLAQLPNSIPPTTRDFNTLASKESFASLIRKRLPDPDPSTFQLTDPSPTEEPFKPTLPSPDSAGSLGKRSGTGSMGVLMSVVNSAKNRRRREAAAGSAASDDEPSKGERTDGETGESISVGSGSEGSGKAKDKHGGKKEKKRAKEDEKRKREDEDEDEEDGKQPQERKRRERRRNLWEEL